MPLSGDDARRALGFVQELARVGSVDEFFRVALGGLAGLVPADLWAFNDIDVSSREVVALFWPEHAVPAPQYLAAMAEVVWEHPVVVEVQRTGDGSPRRISDFWTRERFHESRIYRRVYGPLGVEYHLAFCLADGPGAATQGFGANRSDGDFSDAEVALLAALRAPLRAAWQRAQAGAALAALVGSGDHEGRPLLLLDASNRVRTVTTAAARALAAAGVPIAAGHPAPEPIAGWLRRGGSTPAQGLAVGRNGARVAVRLVAGGADADRLLEVVSAPEDCTRAGHDGDQLTGREREVLAVVAGGATNAEAAAVLGISTRTVQKHLERVYAKLGVTNRTAAAQLLPR